MKYGDRTVRVKVLKSVESKASKAAAAKATTARVESKKRKATGQPKALAKKQKASRTSKVASVGSSED